MSRRVNIRFSKEFLVCLCAFFLTLAFPPFHAGWCAWIALIPALFAIEQARSYRESFILFFSSGFLFCLMSIEWLRHVTYFGWPVACIIVAFYFGCFGLGVRFFSSDGRQAGGWLALPSLWVVLEFVRTEIPVWGFGWNVLGYSQSDYLSVAGLAKWLGAFGVSFLIVLANVALWQLFAGWPEAQTRWRNLRRVMYIGSTVLISCFYFGRQVHGGLAVHPPEISVALIQGNIPQSEKWDAGVKADIIERYLELSKFAAASKPDLIIWPESAWPGILNLDPERESLSAFIRSLGIPFLIGAPYEEVPPNQGFRGRIFNSAFLMNREGEAVAHYDKIRLVPFGEFVPLAPFFNFFGLEKYAYSLGVGDFSAGSDYRVFSVAPRDREVSFSALICFEDTFPELARRLVERGAEFLVVITNDAWFGKSAAARQHLQASIFRAIEEGVPVLRAANTGISAFISPSGRVLDRIRNPRGRDTWIAGGLTRPVALVPQKTFYRKAGYLFPLLCFLAVVFLARRQSNSVAKI